MTKSKWKGSSTLCSVPKVAGAWFASTSYSRCKKMLMNCSILGPLRLPTHSILIGVPLCTLMFALQWTSFTFCVWMWSVTEKCGERNVSLANTVLRYSERCGLSFIGTSYIWWLWWCDTKTRWEILVIWIMAWLVRWKSVSRWQSQCFLMVSLICFLLKTHGLKRCQM